MSDKFQLVKDYYDKGLWDIEKVYNAVGRWITADEYEEIIGESYNGKVE